jgi:hypothetical protein
MIWILKFVILGGRNAFGGVFGERWKKDGKGERGGRGLGSS